MANSRHDAVMLNAVHAAISAADAVTVGLAGLRSKDPDHQRAADLLEQVLGQPSRVGPPVRQLRLLLAKKNLVEYEARRVSAWEAVEALERAGRIVEWARETVARAKF